MNKQEFLAFSLPIYSNKETKELEGEIFKVYEDNPFYMVSNLGRVKSIDKEVTHNYGGKCIKKSKILTQTDNGSGYLSVGLTSKGRTKTTRVSRMVATTFVLNPENKPQVNHINGDKKDNRADNLEWTTSGENVRHAWNNHLAKKRTLFLQIQRRLKTINPYITEGVRVVTPKGEGMIIIDQDCYRIQYDNGKLENLVKSVRFWGKEFKLCLRNLSDLTKEIEHNGEKFIPIDRLNFLYDYTKIGYLYRYTTEYLNEVDWQSEPFEVVKKLIEWKFDIADIISTGEAIDINTLKINPYK